MDRKRPHYPLDHNVPLNLEIVLFLGTFDRIAEAGKNDLSGKVSTRDWPITGGNLSDDASKVENGRDILLTGHEDGSVKFWSCSGIALAPLATVRTNKFFMGDDLDEPRGESFPPVLFSNSFDLRRSDDRNRTTE